MSKKLLLVCMVLVVVFGFFQTCHAELVGYWRFDDGTGTTAVDSSGYGHDAVVEGGGDSVWVEGQQGGGVALGNGIWVSVPPEAWAPIETQFTVAFWAFGYDGLGNNWGFHADGPGGGDRMAGSHIPWGDGNVYYDTADSAGAWQAERISTALDPGLTTGVWNHWAFTKNTDTGEKIIYLNGEPFHSGTNATGLITEIDAFAIGSGPGGANPYLGVIDDFRLYDTELTPTGILSAMTGQPYPKASGADPGDGAKVEATWANLAWRAGDFAVSHDVYLSDTFEDVNNGAEAAFQGNQTDATLIVGFSGFPISDGLVPGTTYYWRIDEVNDAEPNSPWKGDVWSFSIPPRTAYSPIPAEGSKFIATDAPALSWTAGFNAKLHTVYFGASFDEVDAATGGTAQSDTTFTAPGPLEAETTYYWRVDEFDPPATHKGPVWSFVTARDGGGVKGEYFTGMVPSGTPVLTREDPQIDFSWGNAEPDPAVGADNFSARWTGEVEAAFTETYTFYTSSDDGVRLWVNGEQLVNNWTDHGTTENKGDIDLVAGQTYSVVMEYYENGGGAVARLLWSSPRTPKQPVPQAALSLLVHAHSPKPTSGTEGLSLTSDLSWGPGDFAESHDVYFGTDADAVANATKASPEFKGSKSLGQESLDPGQLLFDTTYFWRVDEINPTNPDSPWTGNVWTFWTGDFVVVEDFEGYNDLAEDDPASNRIYLTWIDGFGTTTNGAVAGNLDVPLMAPGRDSAQAMPISYDNAGKTSEATKTLTSEKDWTANGVTKLSLWFSGAGGNAAERMFVALGNAVVYHPDDAATQDGGWNEWVIDLQEFANQGANLSNVTSLTIGFGTRNAPVATGGTGTVEFDDIRLIQ